jgi:acyl-CoA synthetase (AMP-forming)/AMP-acid ligase II
VSATRPSLTARFAETVALQPDRPALRCLGRTWSYAHLAARTGRTTGALARLGVGPDKRLGLLLPPVPTAATAALAGLRLGAEVVPCDPMQRGEALAARLTEVGAGVLVSLDLTRLQQRWLELPGIDRLDAVLVDKMAELLPFPRNLLAPLMRGGEIAPLPRDPRIGALPRLLAKEAERAGTLDQGDRGAILDRTGTPRPDAQLGAAADALLDLAGGAGRWLLAQHLDGARALTALLAPLAAGREVVLLPRLDPRTVAAAIRTERPRVAVLSQEVARSLAQTPPEPGALGVVAVPPDLPHDLRAALARGAAAEVVTWTGAWG